ncbi:hypothetical protein LIER_08666 [Lithospermum erythrorhizon]|uniref:Uncharacterized protein n=1 Tax=Lithospermum erythrorhizon TaxID=34254 RepID=A0AAV3PCZ9_LITER
MVKTRRGLNTLDRATKWKKKGVGPSDDTWMVVEPLIVNQEAQKTKGRKAKTPVSTSMEEEQVFSPTKIRSIPPIDTSQDDTQEGVSLIHDNYLTWVDYTNVRELDNPRPSRVTLENDDVGEEKSHDEINVEEDIIREELAPIVEEIVIDSSGAEMPEVANVSDPPAFPSVKDTTGMDGFSLGGDLLEPTVDDNIKGNVVEVNPENAGPKKKSTKKANAGESCEPKRKLSEEERKAKRARNVERRARRAAKEDVDDDVHGEAKDHL